MSNTNQAISTTVVDAIKHHYHEAHGIDTMSGANDDNPLAALVKTMRRSSLPIVHQVEADDAL